MARIRSISKSSESIRPHRTEVDATYQVLTSEDGATLFHLSTYGSDDRVSKPKVSQTIQLDRSMAQDLVARLRDAFGDELFR